MEGDDFEDGEEEFGGLGDLDSVFDQVFDLFVAFRWSLVGSGSLFDAFAGIEG